MSTASGSRERRFPNRFLTEASRPERARSTTMARVVFDWRTCMRILAITLTALALSAAANAQVPDFTPQTPLIGALLHNDSAAAARLLEGGADPNEGRFIGFPPVLLAVVRQNLDLVRLM